MTKRVNFLPSERIDVPDMVAGTTGVAVGTMQQILDDLVIAKFPRVSSGFRVEVANQISSPGEITVWNGVATDRAGQLFSNEDEENTQRSITFGADGTYYVEIEFTTTPSDSDARAFWDPTFDNGTDPSGDPRLPGREIFQTVSTRLSPDWQIVNPVSTTGFAITTNPDSLRIPVAIITIAAGVVSGATTFPARSCLSQTAEIGATKLYVLDSRVMPDAFSATVDSETVAVASNDRVNGILTLSGPLAIQHLPGARVVRTGAGLNQFLQNRATAALPTSGTDDARPGLFQGNEDRGYALAQNPDGTTRADAQLQALKDQIDFLAAQLREVRFGAERGTDIGALAPPSSFPTPPRYYDRSGGLQGARTAAVSIGDGTTCWGDFNVAQMGSPDAALAAAIATLPVGGGAVFIKGSTSPYDFTTGVAISGRNVTLIGEPGRTTLRATAASAVLRLTNCTLGLRDIHIARQSTATAVAAITTTTGGAMTTYDAYNSTIDGISGTAYCKGLFQNCTIQEITGGSSNGYALASRVVDCTFVKCTFSTTSATAGTRCMLVQALGSKNIALYSCTLTMTSGTPEAIVELQGSNDDGWFTMENCVITGNASTTVQDAVLAGSTFNFRNIHLRNCRVLNTGIGGIINALDAALITVESCNALIAPNGYGMHFADGTLGVTIADCELNNYSGSLTTTYGILGEGTVSDITVERCTFYNLAFGIDLENAAGVRVRDCHATNDSGCGRAFLWVVTSISRLLMSGCEVTGMQDVASSVLAGVRLPAQSTDVSIDGNFFHNIGGAAVAAPASGVLIAETGVSIGHGCSITNNKFRQINSTQLCCGVRCDVSSDVYQDITISHNQFYQINVSGTGGSVAAAAVYFNSINGATVVGNNMDLLGSGTSIPGYGVLIVGIITASTIASNYMANIGTSFLAGGGVMHTGTIAQDCTVSNNTILVTNGALAGIAFNVNATNGATISDLTITGNIIGASTTATSCAVGIDIAPTSNAGDLTESRYVIANNIIRGFTFYGINMQNAAAGYDLAFGISITGNTIESSASTPTGIHIDLCANIAISGNTVNLYNSTVNGKRALVVENSEEIVVAANQFWVYGCSADGMVYFNLCANGSFCSNNMFVVTPNASYRGLTINSGGVEFHVAGNVQRASSIAGASTNLVGAAIAVCRENTNANTGTAPSSLANTNMNWWQL